MRTKKREPKYLDGDIVPFNELEPGAMIFASWGPVTVQSVSIVGYMATVATSTGETIKWNTSNWPVLAIANPKYQGE